MRRTSGTFDELALISAGARGFHTGVFDGYAEQPRLPQYLYGLPVYLARPNFPTEHLTSQFKYKYAGMFLFESGNDPERLTFLGRLTGALAALLLVLCTYAYMRTRAGPWAGLLAAALVAFLPDVLAHGGVAYGDVPLALAYLLALWAIDNAIRAPGLRTGVVAGAASALAFSIKYSAGALLLASPILLALELASGPRKERAWWRRFAGSTLAAALTGYLLLVLIYGGEWDLYAFRWGLAWTRGVTVGGAGWTGYLLGHTSREGWWYFFPVAFLFKTPMALHALMGLGIVAAALRLRHPSSELWRNTAAGPLRAAGVGLIAFGAGLMTAKFNIGFRYALPVLPLLCILTAAGVARLWARARIPLRAAVVVLVLWFITSSLVYYPFFLSYISEYGPGSDRGDKVLVDSSLDWGQGLLELRRWMHEERIPRVYLAYFGSGRPAGYGIDYLPLPSYYRLTTPPPPPGGDPRPAPRFAVISATVLHGLYVPDADPFFAYFRELTPYRVLAHSLLVYDLSCAGQGPPCRPAPPSRIP